MTPEQIRRELEKGRLMARRGCNHLAVTGLLFSAVGAGYCYVFGPRDRLILLLFTASISAVPLGIAFLRWLPRGPEEWLIRWRSKRPSNRSEM